MKEKSIKKDFARYVGVNILSTMGISFYVLADTYFVSKKLGADGLTALNIDIPAYSFLIAVGLLLGMGGATKYAVHKVRGEYEKGNNIFTSSVILGAVLSIFCVLIGNIFSNELVTLLGADEDTFQMAEVYLRILLTFAPFFIFNNIIIAFVRNDNAPNLAMTAVISGSVANVILDYIFIFPLDMGMKGAVVATGFSPIISLLILSVHFILKHNTFKLTFKKIEKSNFGQIISLGMSSFITEIASGIVITVFNLLLLKLGGNTAVASYGIIANLAIVGIAVFNGISQGSQPLMSSCHGSGNVSDLKKLYKYAVTLSLALCIIILSVIFIFTNELIAIFNSEKNSELAEIAFDGLRIYFIGFLFAGINVITASYLNSTEKPVQSFVISIMRGLVAIIILAFALSALFGITGLWFTFPTAELVTFIISAIMMYRIKP